MNRLIKLAIVVVAANKLVYMPRDLQAQRVGYIFEGTFQPGTSGSTSLFGVSVPKNSPLSGTFSYDAATPTGSGDQATYDQHIEAGFTLNIANGVLRLSASDFEMVVTNDFQRQMPVETDDVLDIEYDSTFTPTPRPLLVNDVPWTGTSRSFITLELSWPSDTFSDPALTSSLPGTPGFSQTLYSLVGSLGPKLFTISSVDAIPEYDGDYNSDGALDANDFAEWRKVFGEASAAYADGNGDGIVDAADYVVWRRAQAASSGSGFLQPALVPEPTTLLLMFSGLIAIAACRRKSDPHRR